MQLKGLKGRPLWTEPEEYAGLEEDYGRDTEESFLRRMKRGEVFPKFGESFAPGKPKKVTYKTDVFDRILVSLSPQQRSGYYAFALLTLIATFWFVSAVWMRILCALRHVAFSSFSLPHLFFYTLKNEQAIFVVALLLGAYLALLLGNKYAKASERLPDDEIIRPKRRDWTSNDWLNYSPGEIRRIFTLTSPSRPVNIPVCMLNGNLLNVPQDPKHWQISNQNICMVGLSGTGKTYSGLEVYILTKIVMMESFFSADTKGGILEKYEAMLIEMGYTVRKLIMGDFEHSDGIDLFRPLVQASDARAADYINNMVETLINTAGKVNGRGPDFWTANEMTLLRGLIWYITRSPAYKGERTIKGMMQLLIGGTEKIRQAFEALPESDPAFTASSNFRNSSDTIQDSSRAGLAVKLQIFETPAVMECLSYDTINIKDSLNRPTATFMVTTDYLETYDVIASLFTSHVYQELTEVADSRPGKKLDKPYYIAVDEICNMAAIKSFSKIIATNRSRNIHIAFAIQSVGQLKDKYGELWDNIMGNCAITIFFGCGNEDDKTAEAMSKRCGKVLALTEDQTMSASPLTPKDLRRIRGSVRYTQKYLDLLPHAKAKTLLPDELLVCVAGRNVLRAEPYGAHLHPLAKEAEEAKARLDRKKADMKARGIEQWPEWVDHYMAENENAKLPEEKSFPPSEYEKSVIEPAYSVAERNRFLALARAEEKERIKREEMLKRFEQYKKEAPARAEERSGIRELAKKITIQMEEPVPQEAQEEAADEYDRNFEDFD